MNITSTDTPRVHVPTKPYPFSHRKIPNSNSQYFCPQKLGPVVKGNAPERDYECQEQGGAKTSVLKPPTSRTSVLTTPPNQPGSKIKTQITIIKECVIISTDICLCPPQERLNKGFRDLGKATKKHEK